MQAIDAGEGAGGGSHVTPALEHPALRGVEAERVLPILTRVRPQRFASGAMVSRPDRAHCTLVLAGLLHSYVLVADGRRLLFDIVHAGGIDGLLNVVTGLEGHFTQAVERSTVLTLSGGTIEQLIAADPQVAVNLLLLTLSRLEQRETQLESATYHEATRKLARMLLALARYLGPRTRGRPRLVELRPRPSHQVLADMLGLRRETVTVHLGLLRNLGAVRVAPDHLLLDRGVLEALTEGAMPPHQRAPGSGEAISS